MTPAQAHGHRGKVGMLALVPYLRGRAPELLVVALLSLVATGVTLAQPMLVRQLLNELAAGHQVRQYVWLLVALLLGAAAIHGVRNYLLQRAAEGLVLATRQRLAGHLLRLPVAEYDQRRTGDLLSRAGADTTLLRTVVTSGLLDLVTVAVIIVGATVMMLVLDPLMFAVTLVGMVGMFGAIAVARRVQGVSEQAQARVADLTSALDRALSAVRTIRAARAEARETEVLLEYAHGAYAAGLRVARLMALIGPGVFVAVQGAFLAVLGVGGARVAAGAMSLGDLVAFVLLLFMLMMPIGQAMGAYAQLQAGLGALQRIEDILTVPAETAGDPRAAVAAGPRSAPAVELDGVTFAYPGGEPVLHDISFTIPHGTWTALVGPSGAGKSTVLALVERFYDATTGSLRVAGLDVRDQSRELLRSQLGYVEQETPVLAGTIRDNLLLGVPDATEEELIAVLSAVNLADLVARTPEGLDAQVGEGGVRLSGGERQRLAIARTLLAAPPILLLDEPTGQLDSRNEQSLRHAVAAAAGERTLLVVAHRLATVADADQIVVLDQGRVVATGRHEELTRGNPLYRELAAHQLLVT